MTANENILRIVRDIQSGCAKEVSRVLTDKVSEFKDSTPDLSFEFLKTASKVVFFLCVYSKWFFTNQASCLGDSQGGASHVSPCAPGMSLAHDGAILGLQS